MANGTADATQFLRTRWDAAAHFGYSCRVASTPWLVNRAAIAPMFVGQYGRLGTVVAVPDGTLWFTTSNRDGRGAPGDGDDRILQFRP
jgi:hypothetical protein